MMSINKKLAKDKIVKKKVSKKIEKENPFKEESNNDKNIDDEKLRLATAQADKLELEIAIKRGEYISRTEADKFYGDLVYSFRNKILSLPHELSKILSHENEVLNIEKILKKSVEKALNELSTGK